jgi:hypothetical protein
MDKITSLLQQSSIFCLNSPSDDDLYKIYYIESRNLRNKWYRVIATAFGATSCSCDDQTKNPYQSCNHMKRLDKILKDTPNDIQTLNQIPKFILDIFNLISHHNYSKDYFK